MSKDNMTEVDILQKEQRSIPGILQTVASLIERLADLLDKSEPIPQATLPARHPDLSHPRQTLASEEGLSISKKF